MEKSMVIYKSNDGTIQLEVQLANDTVWLTQAQMAMLFGCSTDNIGLHLKNVYEEQEIERISTAEDFSVVRKEGNRYVNRTIKHYNLDAILSVGYRVSSAQATKFRQWANKILKDYILKGYAINKRFEQLEQRVSQTEDKIDFFVKTALPPVEGVFYDGQIFDAYVFASDYTANLSKDLKLDLDKHNSQYQPIDIKVFKNSHDRFLIIDDEVYHIGASLKDLGKKMFAFSKLNFEKEKILEIL